MIHSPPPTILDNVNFKHDIVKVIQTYHPTTDLINHFQNINKQIIILVYLGEYHLYSWIEEILANSKNYYLKNGKLKNYYIILSVHEYPHTLLDEYSDFLTFIYEPCLYNYYINHFNKITLVKNIKYPFLSMNNRASVARQSLYYFFSKFNLFEKSYFSYLGELSRTEYKNYNQITNDIISANNHQPWYCKNLNYSYLNKKIPLNIANDSFNGNYWSVGQNKYYEETFCSLVFETYDNQEFAFLSEKTWKPIAFGHPFIVYSNKNLLKKLHSLGFETFESFWDEDYDKLSGNHRLESIFHLILEIANWPKEKLISTHNKLLPILEHNQNNFFNFLPKRYEEIKPKLINKIKNIIEEKINLI